MIKRISYELRNIKVLFDSEMFQFFSVLFILRCDAQRFTIKIKVWIFNNSAFSIVEKIHFVQFFAILLFILLNWVKWSLQNWIESFQKNSDEKWTEFQHGNVSSIKLNDRTISKNDDISLTESLWEKSFVWIFWMVFLYHLCRIYLLHKWNI